MGEPFYSNGLNFTCARCSACCRGGPGYVFLSKDDLRHLLLRFQLDFRSFISKYCTFVDIGSGFAISLKEKDNYDCILWEPSGCLIYNDRPVQCSTFPFWASILDSEKNWLEAGQDCLGIGNGSLRSRVEIEEQLYIKRKMNMILVSRDEAADLENIDENSILGR